MPFACCKSCLPGLLVSSLPHPSTSSPPSCHCKKHGACRKPHYRGTAARQVIVGATTAAQHCSSRLRLSHSLSLSATATPSSSPPPPPPLAAPLLLCHRCTTPPLPLPFPHHTHHLASLPPPLPPPLPACHRSRFVRRRPLEQERGGDGASGDVEARKASREATTSSSTDPTAPPHYSAFLPPPLPLHSQPPIALDL